MAKGLIKQNFKFSTFPGHARAGRFKSHTQFDTSNILLNACEFGKEPRTMDLASFTIEAYLAMAAWFSGVNLAYVPLGFAAA